MEREIKFRAWDVKNKRMIDKHIQSLIFAHHGLVIEYHNPPLQAHLKIYGGIIMQYIGIKDKNEREIYEGDILKISRCSELEIVKIKIKNAIWNDDFWSVGFECNKDCEIIGNIYENPELWNRKN